LSGSCDDASTVLSHNGCQSKCHSTSTNQCTDVSNYLCVFRSVGLRKLQSI
jgi:hypothetical protein